MAFIPGGFEDDYDSEDDECLVYANDSLKRDKFVEPSAATVAPNQASVGNDATNQANQSDESPVDWQLIANNKPVDRRAFLTPTPSSPVAFRRSTSSPSPGALILDDIRLAVINDNLDYIRSQIEAESGRFFMDTILKSGWTCLMYAASCGHPQIVHYCLEKKADPNYHKDMFTPLMATCSSSSFDEEKLLLCVQYLLNFGALIGAMNKYLNTALMFAAKQGRTLIVKELIHHNADLDKQDNHGWTALHLAAHPGHGTVVRILLDAGADASILNSSGQTAADVAFDGNHKEIADILDRLRKVDAGDRKLSVSEIEALQTSKPRSRTVLSQEFVAKESNKPRYHDDLEIFLSGLQLSSYIPLFEHHCISLRDLLLFTEEDLDKMGINKLGVKRKILEGIKGTHRKDWERTSLVNLRDQRDYISCPDAVAMMANISKHLLYIDTTVAYLRHQIKKNPQILELGQEAAGVCNLLADTDESLVNTRHVFDELRFFKKDMARAKQTSQLLPVDLIKCEDPDLPQEDTQQSSRGTKITIGLITVSAGAAFALKYHREAVSSIISKTIGFVLIFNKPSIS